MKATKEIKVDRDIKHHDVDNDGIEDSVVELNETEDVNADVVEGIDNNENQENKPP